MRISAPLLALLLLLSCGSPGFAQEYQRPDSIVEKMAVKLVRGVTNVVTSPLELPKQTFVTTKEQGGVGLIIGPLKGIGMTLYRAFTGTVETIFFVVPQPGYYDSMINPDYVWNGGDDKRNRQRDEADEPVQAASQEKKGESPEETVQQKPAVKGE